MQSTRPAESRQRKPARTLSLDLIGSTPILTIKQHLSSTRTELDTYLVAEIRSDIGGRGFVLDKVTPRAPTAGIDAGPYHVLVNGTKAGTCDCPGFVRHGKCKHAAALLKLIELGKLGEPKPAEPQHVTPAGDYDFEAP